MHEFSLEYIRCVRCHSKLSVEILHEDSQIDEGLLLCPKCKLHYPIIGKVPILWNDFTSYLSNRPRLGGELLTRAKTAKMLSFVRRTLRKIRKNLPDQSIIEKHWAEVYKNNKNSKFYSDIKSQLRKSKSKLALEHGCSVGHITQALAKTNSVVFGIDKSYHAVVEAKKSKQPNLDFFVADSLEQPFGNAKFDLVVGLNLFELIEPKSLLRILATQVGPNGWLVLSDPYDYTRQPKSIKNPMFEDEVRNRLRRYGFTISKHTKTPSYILWNLKLHKRASLQYRVDVVVAKKSS